MTRNVRNDIPVYSINDLLDTITAIQEGYGEQEFSEKEMDAIYAFVSDVTGLSIDKIWELMQDAELSEDDNSIGNNKENR